MAGPARPLAQGIELDLKVTPRAGRSAIGGVRAEADGALRLVVRLKEAPSDGAANAALLRLLGEAFEVPRTACTLVAGASGRLKRVRILGEPRALMARVEALAAAEAPS